MQDFELLQLNHEGFIPGPLESEESFVLRIAHIKAKAAEKKIPRAHLEWTTLHLKELFDFSPQVLPIFYSNHSLPFWQGGCCWVEEGVVALQLRKKFETGSYWGYSRDELIAHEAAHAARGAFKERRFEEVFAYLTSEKKWRRVLGPIIQRPWEVWPFLLSLIFTFFSLVGYLLATLWLILGFIRLVRTRLLLNRASKSIYKILKDEKLVRAVLFRLTDDEIHLFAKGIDMIAYAEKQTELRWRLINLAYLKGKSWQK